MLRIAGGDPTSPRARGEVTPAPHPTGNKLEIVCKTAV